MLTKMKCFLLEDYGWNLIEHNILELLSNRGKSYWATIPIHVMICHAPLHDFWQQPFAETPLQLSKDRCITNHFPISVTPVSLVLKYMWFHVITSQRAISENFPEEICFHLIHHPCSGNQKKVFLLISLHHTTVHPITDICSNWGTCFLRVPSWRSFLKNSGY